MDFDCFLSLVQVLRQNNRKSKRWCVCPSLQNIKDAVDDATAETATALVDGGGGATAISHARIAKVIKPRPYGLFLAEKGASLFLTNLWFINDFQRIIIVIIIIISRTTTSQDGEG